MAKNKADNGLTAQGKDDSLEIIQERHAKDKYAFDSLSDPEKARFQIRKRIQYETEPWTFLTDCVYTLDQVDQRCPIKPFPSDLEYLEFLTALWVAETKIAIPKSRRMTCSWNFIALYLWDTMFKTGRFNGFVSKKEDDAGDLVGRAEFIFQQIPEWRIPKALLPAIKNGRMSKQPPILEFPDLNSKIQGFPQGAGQLRQYTLSGILGDECAFWEQAQQFYSASAPTLEGGGKMTLISSRSPGFFKKIVFDRLDSTELTFKEKAPVPVKRPIEGVEFWKNPDNEFVVVDLHYTANPRKRSPEWREAVRKSLPIRDFLMEYEKSWQTYEGKPVYEDWNNTLHKTDTIEIEPGLPLLLGWDFGLSPACVICQLVGKQLRIIKEFIETDGSINKLAPVVWSWLSTECLTWVHDSDRMIKSFIDPAGFNRAETDEGTCAKVLRAEGFKKLLPGPVRWEPRRQAVEHFLTRTYGSGSGLLVAEDDCPITYEGFNGGYQYPEKVREIEPNKIMPLKNKFSHPHDAIQYVCAGAKELGRQYADFDDKLPGYSFQSGKR